MFWFLFFCAAGVAVWLIWRAKQKPRDLLTVADWSPPATAPLERWTLSDRGNPTFTLAGLCVTVFPQDKGWKYVIAEEGRDDRATAEFSDRYNTVSAAKIAAMEHFLERADV